MWLFSVAGDSLIWCAVFTLAAAISMRNGRDGRMVETLVAPATTGLKSTNSRRIMCVILRDAVLDVLLGCSGGDSTGARGLDEQTLSVVPPGSGPLHPHVGGGAIATTQVRPAWTKVGPE